MGSFRILIVESEDEVAGDLGGRLAALGHTVAGRARGGREALGLLEACAPDAAVIDLDLPGDLDAAQTAHGLRRLRNLPILLTRPLESPAGSMREILASPSACLRKPFCDREIGAVLEAVLPGTPSLLGEMVDHSGALVYAKDLQGRYLFVNRRWVEVCDLTPERALGRTDRDLFPRESWEHFEAHDRQVAASGLLLETEETLHGPGGPRYFLSQKFPFRDGAGWIVGLFGLTTEITALKEAGIRMRRAFEESQLFRAVLDESPVHVFIKDRERRYLYANRQTLVVFGQTPESIVGKSDADLLGEEAAAVFREADERVLAGERWDGEVPVVLPGGEPRVFWDVKSPLWSEDQGPLPWGLLGFATDVTERRRAEAERARLEEQLQETNKLESLGRLAGGVAHDFNNMLGVILGQAEMASAGLPPEHPLAEALLEIRGAARRSADLTRQLLTFARRQTVHPKVLDLNATVEGMRNILTRLLGERLELVWLPGQDLWPVRIDPSQADQILANLCVNARDALSGRGSVTLQTRNVPDGVLEGRHLLPGDAVLLRVRDDGCGMDPAVRARVFEPFFTTKSLLEGTGLGLSTVYGIVQQNGGVIEVESEPGQGSSFQVLLPRHLGPAPATPEEPEVPARVRPAGRGTVLLVEDEPLLLRMTRTMLEHLGYSVIPCGHPAEAARLAREQASEIDLLLTDIVMPEMSGLELGTRVQASCPQVAIVFMSGYSDEVLARQGSLEEGMPLLAKPFTMAGLEAALQEARTRP